MNRMLLRFGRKPLLVASMAAAAAALAILPLAGPTGAVFVMILLGVGLSLPQPLTMAWVISHTAPDLHGSALGMRLTANRFGQTLIPMVIGGVAVPLGIGAIFWANAALLALSGAVVFNAPHLDRPQEATDES